MHCKKVTNSCSQRLWIWAALYCKGFDNSTSTKYDEHSTSRHSKHTPLEGSLSSELVCLGNKSVFFNKCMRSSDGLLCWFPWHNRKWQDHWIGTTSSQQGLASSFIWIMIWCSVSMNWCTLNEGPAQEHTGESLARSILRVKCGSSSTFITTTCVSKSSTSTSHVTSPPPNPPTELVTIWLHEQAIRSHENGVKLGSLRSQWTCSDCQ